MFIDLKDRKYEPYHITREGGQNEIRIGHIIKTQNSPRKVKQTILKQLKHKKKKFSIM